MDETLLGINTGPRFGYYLKQQKDIGWMDLVKTAIWGLGYTLSVVNVDKIIVSLVQQMNGMKEQDFRDKVDVFVQTEVLQAVLPAAVDRVKYHKNQGHINVLLSSALSYMAEPVAAFLGIDAVLCTRLEVRDGVFTGRCELPICYGQSKVYYAEQFALQHNVHLEKSFFYTDSYSDIAMLHRVGNPRVVNGDPRLRCYAKKRGWMMERW